MPIKLQIKSSISKLLPNTICSSSTMNGTAMATTKMFFLLTLSVTNGRKNPNGKNIAMFPMSMVFTQLPIVSSPAIIPEMLLSNIRWMAFFAASVEHPMCSQ